MKTKKTIRMGAAALAVAFSMMTAMSVPALAYDGSTDTSAQTETSTDTTTTTTTTTETEQIGTVTTQGGRLNLRDGGSTDYNVIGQLACGDTVTVLSEENGWYKVIVHEKTGYVSGQYLTVSDSSTATITGTDTSSTTSGSPLTPDGNLELVDDVTQESDGKQFITVQSKNDNTFYIVIDRDKDTDNVYFMNLVDEADLMALMEDGEVTVKCTCDTRCEAGDVDTTCPVCKNNMVECTGVEEEQEAEITTEPTEDDTEKTESKGSSAPVLLILLIIGLGAGGAVYYLKFKKPKTDTKGLVDLDDYDFGDDDEDDTEYVIEDDLPEETDEANDNEEE
jgi:uncharacterized protein YraI